MIPLPIRKPPIPGVNPALMQAMQPPPMQGRNPMSQPPASPPPMPGRSPFSRPDMPEANPHFAEDRALLGPEFDPSMPPVPQQNPQAAIERDMLVADMPEKNPAFHNVGPDFEAGAGPAMPGNVPPAPPPAPPISQMGVESVRPAPPPQSITPPNQAAMQFGGQQTAGQGRLPPALVRAMSGLQAPNWIPDNVNWPYR